MYAITHGPCVPWDAPADHGVGVTTVGYIYIYIYIYIYKYIICRVMMVAHHANALRACRGRPVRSIIT